MEDRGVSDAGMETFFDVRRRVVEVDPSIRQGETFLREVAERASLRRSEKRRFLPCFPRDSMNNEFLRKKQIMLAKLLDMPEMPEHNARWWSRIFDR